MSATPPVSPAGSVSGYNWKTWLTRNKNYLKGLVSIVAALITAFLPEIKNTNLSIAAGGAVGILSKMALDALDFWLSDVPTPHPQVSVPTVSAQGIADAVKRSEG